MKINSKIKYSIATVVSLVGIILSNLYLQWCQNNLSADLALKFAFSWHTEKFLLGSLVLGIFYLFLISLAGSWIAGTTVYSVIILLIGYATYLKMLYRQEPIYPDDLKMVTQFDLLKEMIGTGPFVVAILIVIGALGIFGWQLYRSIYLPKKRQIIRVSVLILSFLGLIYVSHFNDETNVLRKAYNSTALWIPYSQQMNYYNTGFMGGFLFNLRVEAMEEPKEYSEKTIDEITEKYQPSKKGAIKEPNIIYIMSESFSDPSHLNGLEITGDPLKEYYERANQTYSGKMLSQNYGGGTANIEFEALTSFSMELFNPQMTTPYTLLVPKMDNLPSLVSLTEQRGYETTAIHPYDTSMYKRKDVYDILGFNQFLDQETMKHTDKIEQNPYISDKAAYDEIMDILKDNQHPQFVHLVTMQTHMPYGGKYDTLHYSAKGTGNMNSVGNYLQDIAYSSQALSDFINQVEQLPRRTLIVFWGDHLPGIYSDEVQAENEKSTLHETEFLMWDSQNEWKFEPNQITSPFYFAPNLFERSNLPLSPFYDMLLKLENELPAFEKGMYLQDGQWQSELALDQKAQEIYNDYQLIQYDIVQGKQYSVDKQFFE
ncbi:MAG TPA: sulfatase-like hydrolase/transferase [Enterococcus sp.]|nr:sulfatase-like hydrolase/transferase [Enterococcus sp.]